MDYIIWILLGVALFILFIAITVNKTSDSDDTTPTDYRPHQQKREYHPLPPQINDEPILSSNILSLSIFSVEKKVCHRTENEK